MLRNECVPNELRQASNKRVAFWLSTNPSLSFSPLAPLVLLFFFLPFLSLVSFSLAFVSGRRRETHVVSKPGMCRSSVEPQAYDRF